MFVFILITQKRDALFPTRSAIHQSLCFHNHSMCVTLWTDFILSISKRHQFPICSNIFTVPVKIQWKCFILTKKKKKKKEKRGKKTFHFQHILLKTMEVLSEKIKIDHFDLSSEFRWQNEAHQKSLKQTMKSNSCLQFWSLAAKSSEWHAGDGVECNVFFGRISVQNWMSLFE